LSSSFGAFFSAFEKFPPHFLPSVEIHKETALVIPRGEIASSISPSERRGG